MASVHSSFLLACKNVLKMENEFRMKTLKSRFDELLIRVADNLTSEDRTKFRYIFRESLPSQILERDEPLVWFHELERKGKLAADNLGFLKDFLKQSDLISWLNVVKRFEIKQQLLAALREGSECRSRGRLRFVLLADQHSAIQATCEPVTTKQLHDQLDQISKSINSIKIIVFVGAGLALMIATARPYF